jgi:hypothetical protein
MPEAAFGSEKVRDPAFGPSVKNAIRPLKNMEKRAPNAYMEA